MRLKTTIDGIPCIVVVRIFSLGNSAIMGKFADYSWPPEPPELDIEEVLDRKGYPAPWLERKLTDDDQIRIENEAIREARDK